MHTAIDFDVTDAISRRHSVRTFDADKPVCKETLQTLLRTAKELPNPFNASGVKIAIANKSEGENEKIGTYGVIKGAKSYMGLGVDGNETQCLAGAYALEASVLKATSMGLGTVWLGGTLKRKSFFEAFGFKSPALLPAVIAVGYPAPRRLAEKAFRFVANSDSRKPWEKLFFENDLHTPLTMEAAGIFAQALSNLRLAPSSLNGQPWRVVKQGDRFHFCADIHRSLSGLELMLKYIDMGIAISHFHLTIMQESIAGSFKNESPALELPENFRCITTFTVK